MKAVFAGVFTIVTTHRCNFKCTHCYGEFNQKGDDLGLAEGLEAIKEYSTVQGEPGDKLVSFFGGEPTLNKHLFAYIKYASSLNIKTMITTNAWWAVLGQEYINRLKYSGLQNVILSCDVYHLKFICWEAIKWAYNQLSTAGIRAYFNWTSQYFIHKKNKDVDFTKAIEEISPFIPREDIQKYLVKPETKNIIDLAYLGRATGILKPARMWDMMVPGTGELVNLRLLPEYKVSLNCSYDMPFSVYSYKPGELIKTVSDIQEWKEYNYPKMKQKLIRNCIECNLVMMDLLGRNKINLVEAKNYGMAQSIIASRGVPSPFK
jgi:hypothetical protein